MDRKTAFLVLFILFAVPSCVCRFFTNSANFTQDSQPKPVLESTEVFTPTDEDWCPEQGVQYTYENTKICAATTVPANSRVGIEHLTGQTIGGNHSYTLRSVGGMHCLPTWKRVTTPFTNDIRQTGLLIVCISPDIKQCSSYNWFAEVNIPKSIYSTPINYKLIEASCQN